MVEQFDFLGVYNRLFWARGGSISALNKQGEKKKKKRQGRKREHKKKFFLFNSAFRGWPSPTRIVLLLFLVLF